MPTVIDYSKGGGLDKNTFYGFNMFPATDGTELVDAITCNSVACDYISDGKAIIAWVETATLKVAVGNNLLSETNHTLGTAETIDASVSDTEWIDVVMTSTTQGYVFYQGTATTLNVCPFTVSGNTVTAGSPATIASITSGYTLEGLVAAKVNSTKIAIAWRDSNSSTARPIYRAATYYDLGGTPTVSTILDDASTSGSDPYHPQTMFICDASDRALIGINHNGGVGDYLVIDGLSTNSLSQIDKQNFASSGRGGCIAGSGGDTTAIGISIDTNSAMVIEELSNLDTATIAASTVISGARLLNYATQMMSCAVGADSAFVFGANQLFCGFGIENADGSPIISGAGLANPKDPGAYPTGSLTKKTVDCCKLSNNAALGIWVDNATDDLFMTRFR